jgi:hypothetical protein
MTVGFQDLSGNNPTHFLMDRPTLRSAPAVEYGAVTADPTAADVRFPKIARAIYVGTGGALAVVDYRGNVTIFSGIVAGSILDVQAIGTNASGSVTTANIIPLY